MFSLIVAHDREYVIGFNGWMPWHLKDDLKQFKERTIHHRVVMGLTTFQTMKKPLPERHTVVVCYPSEAKENTEEVSYCTDFIAFLEANKDTEEEIFICGGASIYRQALPYCKKLYISLVDGKHPADTYFPHYNEAEYHVMDRIPYEGFTLIEYCKKDA